MVEQEPLTEPMLDSDEATVTPWTEARDRLTHGIGQWLATTRPDGRPHVMPVGVVWLDDRLYFTSGQGTVKGANLEHNSYCVITTRSDDYDLVVEGEAAKLSDEAKLQQLAAIYNAEGWPATVKDGAFDAPFSAPTTGPAPYTVYEVTPKVAFALGTTEETVNRCTRYRF